MPLMEVQKYGMSPLRLHSKSDWVFKEEKKIAIKNRQRSKESQPGMNY